MNEYVKKMFFMSMGMAAVGKAKMDEFAKEYADLYKKSETEGQKVYHDLLAEAEKAQKDLESKLKDMVEKGVENLNIASLERVSSLEARVAALEEKLKS